MVKQHHRWCLSFVLLTNRRATTTVGGGCRWYSDWCCCRSNYKKTNPILRSPPFCYSLMAHTATTNATITTSTTTTTTGTTTTSTTNTTNNNNSTNNITYLDSVIAQKLDIDLMSEAVGYSVDQERDNLQMFCMLVLCL
eukprot:GHVS01090778.1.p1 GENE.GHVS01090778.1~~GHVS01090778.1.p1  ORF type:complete len:139 (-),score=40.77 GHVS01090778.1:47-463(-)